jgi:hypothetical protein
MGRGIRLTHEELNLIDLLRLKTSSADVFRNCLIITMLHFGDTIGQITEVGLLYQDCRANSPQVSRARTRCSQAAETTGKTKSGDPGIHRGHERNRGYQSPGSGLRILHMVHQTIGGPPQEDHGNWLQRRSVESAAASSWYSVQRLKHTMKGKRDEAAYQKATEELEHLKKKRPTPTLRKF